MSANVNCLHTWLFPVNVAARNIRPDGTCPILYFKICYTVYGKCHVERGRARILIVILKSEKIYFVNRITSVEIYFYPVRPNIWCSITPATAVSPI